MPEPLMGKKNRRGRPGLTPEDHDRILVSARALLAQKGAGGLRVRELAERSGVATGSLYKFYPELDALIGAVNLETYRELTAHLHAAGALQTSGSPLQTLMQLARSYLVFVRDNAALWAVLLDYNRGRTGRAEAFVEAEDALFALVEEALSGLPRLEDRDQPVLARALWASVHGIVVQTLPNSLQPDPAADTLRQIEMIVGAVVRDYG